MTINKYHNYLLKIIILSVCLVKIKKLAYFTIQLIFAIIHEPYCTF